VIKHITWVTTSLPGRPGLKYAWPAFFFYHNWNDRIGQVANGKPLRQKKCSSSEQEEFFGGHAPSAEPRALASGLRVPVSGL